MTFPVISSADAEQLLSFFRDSDFDWTVAQLPALYERLGWTVTTQVPNAGAVADTSWGVPDTSARVMFTGGVVNNMTVRVTGRADTSPQGRLEVADVFARLVTTATKIMGDPSLTARGPHPKARWRNEHTTVTLRGVVNGVIVVWATNRFQDHADNIERYRP